MIPSLVATAIGAVIFAGPIGAQSTKGEWKAIVRIVPNPLPAGRCAAVRVEVQDDERYQSTQLADGRAVDSRTFKYENSMASAFRWQNDNPAGGVLCAPDGAAARWVLPTRRPRHQHGGHRTSLNERCAEAP
ncbi:MAG: hypothetical protein ABJD07_09860 [Gemmatimonadaceae bacterium]